LEKLEKEKKNTNGIGINKHYLPEFSAFVEKYKKHEKQKGETIASQALQIIASAIAFLVFPFMVLAMVVSGFKYVMSHGETDMMDSAKKGIINAVIGFFVALFAYVIINQILNTIKDIDIETKKSVNVDNSAT